VGWYVDDGVACHTEVSERIVHEVRDALVAQGHTAVEIKIPKLMHCIEKFVHLLGNDAGVRIVECLNGEKPVWFQENCKAAITLRNYKSFACWAIGKLGFKGEG